MRSGKQNPTSTSGRGGRGDSRNVVDDLGDDVWNFMSFCKKDFVKDSIPDQQLSLQDLTVRYKGEFRSVLNLTERFDRVLNSFFHSDTKKSVLQTMAAMDLDKINMDLVESLLEWIVDGKHSYPAGRTVTFRLRILCSWLTRLSAGAVLVFMPGLAEIKMLYEQLQSNRMFNNRGASRSALTQDKRVVGRCLY